MLRRAFWVGRLVSEGHVRAKNGMCEGCLSGIEGKVYRGRRVSPHTVLFKNVACLSHTRNSTFHIIIPSFHPVSPAPDLHRRNFELGSNDLLTRPDLSYSSMHTKPHKATQGCECKPGGLGMGMARGRWGGRSVCEVKERWCEMDFGHEGDVNVLRG